GLAHYHLHRHLKVWCNFQPTEQSQETHSIYTIVRVLSTASDTTVTKGHQSISSQGANVTMPRSRVTLGDLPKELFLRIIVFVDGKTVVISCRLVCRSWKSAIDGSMELQLVIELWADGMVAGDLPDLTNAETLDALYERRRAWLGLNWSSRIELKVHPLHHAHRLTGGVFGQLWSTSFTATWLPSARNQTTRTSTIDFGVQRSQFVMDPTQDLVVFVYMAAYNVVNVDCRSLSSLEPYHLATLSVVLTYCGARREYIVAVALAGNILSVLFFEGLVLFNWREGTVLAVCPECFILHCINTVQGTDGDFPPVRPDSFSLVSPRAYILGYKKPQPRLEIWAFEGNIYNHIATLQLPELVRNVEDTSFTTYSTGFWAVPGAGRQFSKSNDERLFVVYFLSKHLFVHFRYLQRYLLNRDGPVVVPWNEWGPQHTRM
ncbi:hypothetical protein GGX14DRAFT_647866, partial [Mycena pura]